MVIQRDTPSRYPFEGRVSSKYSSNIFDLYIYRPIMKFVLLMWTEIKYWHANSIISIHDSSNGQNCHNNSFDSHIFLIKFKWTIVMKFGNLNSNFVQRIEFPYALTLGHRSTLMSVLNTFLNFE